MRKVILMTGKSESGRYGYDHGSGLGYLCSGHYDSIRRFREITPSVFNRPTLAESVPQIQSWGAIGYIMTSPVDGPGTHPRSGR